MKGKRSYYVNGQYHSPEDDAYLKHKQNKIKKRKKRLMILCLCIIGMAVLLKVTVYTSQYHWSNELVWAIQKQDIAEVQELLNSDKMNINKPGGVEFPAYILGLSETSPITPLEEACWGGDYDIVELLIERGADARIGDAWSLALTEYGTEDYKIIKLLLEHGADANQKIEDSTAPLLQVAAWAPTEEAERFDMKEEVVAQDITNIYKLIRAYSGNKDPVDKITGDTPIKLAKAANNQILIKFLESKTAALYCNYSELQPKI